MATNKFEAAKENSWPLLKNCLIIFAIASIPGLAGGYIFLSHRSFWQQAEATQGKITGKSKSTACSYDKRSQAYTDCHDYYHPVFTYSVAGISYTSTSESQMSPDIGELVDVAYSSADPQIAELREGISWMPFNAVLLFGFAAVGYVIAILYFKLYLDIWLRYRRYLKEKRKYSHQQKCAA